MTQLRMLWQYLGWIGIPNLDSMGFYHDDLPWSRSLFEPATLLAASGWFVLLLGCWMLRQRLPILAFAVLWYLVGHSLESTVLPLEMVFEHRNYLPSIGPLVLIAFAIYSLPAVLRPYAHYCAAGVLVLVAILLLSRTVYWGDAVLLAERHYHTHPESMRTRLQLASAYHQAGNPTRSLQIVNELQLDPTLRHTDAALRQSAKRYRQAIAEVAAQSGN